MRNTIVWLHRLLRIHIKKNGFDKIPNSNCLFILNHNSNFDPMLLIDALKKPVICITKPENLKIPIVGKFIHHSGFLSLNREDAKEAITTINKASKILKDNIGNICIFPEGTRNKTENPLLPFHSGSFKIATKSSSPIAIIDLKNTKCIKQNMPFKHSNVEMNVIKILNENDYINLSTKEIADIAYNEILDDYTK